MLPTTISKKLSSLRRYERSLRFLWGISRWVAVVLVLLALACLTDWAVDRWYETPWALRVMLFVGQVAVGLAVAYRWLVRPVTSRLSDGDIALLVEEKTPGLRHRLISVVQFHQPGAQTGGMSRELIGRVTEETEQQTASLNFADALDKRRVKWSLAALVPVLALAAVPVLLWPELVQVLLQRQLLQDVGIPRSVYVEGENPAVWPRGEDLVLRFRVKGAGWTADDLGLVRVDAEGQTSLYFDMEYEADAGPEEAIFVAPPRSKREAYRLPTLTNFTYRAWLKDGRTANASELRFEPRPVIDSQQIRAWVLLPNYVPARPSGHPYEIEQPRGDIVALPGSSARVWIKIQKPVRKATLHLLGPVPLESNPIVLTGMTGLARTPLAALTLPYAYASEKNVQQLLLGPEIPLREAPMTLLGEGDEAEAVVSLPATATGYRLIVEDEYGFKNIPAPRRGIRIVPEDPPQVAMLPTIFDAGVSVGSAEDFPLDGLPIPPKGKLRIAYTASAPFGMGEAVLHYRVMKLKSLPDDGSHETEFTPWYEMPLIEKKATEKSGPFLPHRGIFQFSADQEQIQFHAIPSPDRGLVAGRKLGGGRFDFHTVSMLLDTEGKPIPLQPGDQVEYKIEIAPARGKEVNPFRKSGFSETRTVSVVTEKEWWARMVQYDQETAKIRKLKGDQGKVFP